MADTLTLVERTAFLKSLRVLSSIPLEALAELAGRAREIHCEPGDVVFREGDPNRGTFFVVDGLLEQRRGRALLAVFRPRGIPVIYTKFLAGPERTLIWDWSPQVAPPVCCCWKGFLRFYEDVGKELDCADIIDEIYPEPGDPIVDKFGYGAFHNTNLDDLLKARHVESVLITGTVTQICVEETARESFKRGYPTTLVSDAVSTYAPDLQTAVLKNFAHKFGWVSTAKEVIAALEPLAIR